MLPKPAAANPANAAPLTSGVPVATPKMVAKPQLPSPAANLQAPRLVAKNVGQALGPAAQAPLPSPNRAAFPPFLAQLPNSAKLAAQGSKVSPENLKNLQKNWTSSGKPSAANSTPQPATSKPLPSPTKPNLAPTRPEPSPPKSTSVAPKPQSAPTPTTVKLVKGEAQASPRAPVTNAPPSSASQSKANLAPLPKSAPPPASLNQLPTKAESAPTLGVQARTKLESQLSRAETRSNRPVIKREPPPSAQAPVNEENVASKAELKEPSREKLSEPAPTAREVRESASQVGDSRPAPESAKPSEAVSSSALAPSSKPETPTPAQPEPTRVDHRNQEHQGASASGGQGGGKGGGQRRRSRREDQPEEPTVEEVGEVQGDEGDPSWGMAFSAEARAQIPLPRMLQLAKLEADRYAIAQAAREQSGEGESPPRRESPPRSRALPQEKLEVEDESLPSEAFALQYCKGCGTPIASRGGPEEQPTFCLGCQGQKAQALLAFGLASIPYRLFWSVDSTPVESLAIFRLRDFLLWRQIFKTISLD